MWSVRPATMTRRTERLSRLLRLWLTTMPSDFTTLTELPISPHEVGGFSFLRLIGGGFHQGGVGAAGVPA